MMKNEYFSGLLFHFRPKEVFSGLRPRASWDATGGMIRNGSSNTNNSRHDRDHDHHPHHRRRHRLQKKKTKTKKKKKKKKKKHGQSSRTMYTYV